jgi:hypothetical protein
LTILHVIAWESWRARDIFSAELAAEGARFISRGSWPVGKRVVVSDALLNYRTTAEVVYCTPHSSRRFAVGVKFQPHRFPGSVAVQ